jgi:hypothetical protein
LKFGKFYSINCKKTIKIHKFSLFAWWYWMFSWICSRICPSTLWRNVFYN